MTTLGSLGVGHHGEIMDARGQCRLMELGFLPGAAVEVISDGDTMLVRLGDQRMCLRRDSAERVSVLELD